MLSLPVLLIAVILLVSVILLASLGSLARRFRPGAPSCPLCAHNVHGLALPRCPECGTSLEDGVIGTEGVSTRRIWATTATLVLGMVLALSLYGAMTEVWPRALQSMNLSYWVERGMTTINVEVDSAHLVRVEMMRSSRPELKEVVEPRVSLLIHGGEIAGWQSDQTINASTFEQIEFDAAPAIANLRRIIPANSDSPFAALLHDEGRAEIFQEAIESFVASEEVLQGYWPDGTGGKLFQGSIGRGISLQRSFVPAPFVFDVPIYLAPIAIFGAFVLVAYRVFWRNRELVAFKSAVAA